MIDVRSRRLAWVILGLGLVILVLGSWSGAQFRTATILSPFFREPSGLAISDKGELLVAVEESRIHVYDDQGRFLRGWGLAPEQGAIRLQLSGSDTVEVVRSNHDTVSVYDLSGDLLSSHDQPGAFDRIGVERDRRVIAPAGDIFELGPEGLVHRVGTSERLIVSTPRWPLEVFGAEPLIPVALLMAGGAIMTMIGLVMTADSSSRS